MKALAIALLASLALPVLARKTPGLKEVSPAAQARSSIKEPARWGIERSQKRN